MTEQNQNINQFWNVILMLVKWRRLIVVNFIITAILAFAVSSFMPKWYQSSASIFPPEKESNALSLASSLMSGGVGSLLSGSGMSLPAFATLSDIYSAVLTSRSVGESVIDDNDLLEVYGTTSLEKALLALAGHTSITIEPNGIINISVEDKAPEKARILVLSYLKHLNRVNRESRSSQAAATRQFIEERLDQTKRDLAAAEDESRNFQLENNAISIIDQVKATIENLAELNSQLVKEQIELGVIQRFLLPSHTEIKQKEATIEEIESQIVKLQSGDGEESGESSLIIPAYKTPDLSLEFIRLTRNLKIQEAIFELLTQQHEQSKIQEKRNTPTIQVLDEPKVPELKIRPKRAKLSLVAGILCVFLTTIVVLLKEFIKLNKSENTETYKQLDKITMVLRRDFYALRSIFLKKPKEN